MTTMNLPPVEYALLVSRVVEAVIDANAFQYHWRIRAITPTDPGDNHDDGVAITILEGVIEVWIYIFRDGEIMLSLFREDEVTPSLVERYNGDDVARLTETALHYARGVLEV